MYNNTNTYTIQCLKITQKDTSLHFYNIASEVSIKMREIVRALFTKWGELWQKPADEWIRFDKTKETLGN